jgi:hypothetical protein
MPQDAHGEVLARYLDDLDRAVGGMAGDVERSGVADSLVVIALDADLVTQDGVHP